LILFPIRYIVTPSVDLQEAMFHMRLWPIGGTTMGEDFLLDVQQAAQRLGGVSRWSIYTWVAQGRLRKTKVGTRVMFRVGDLENFVRSCNEADSRIEARAARQNRGAPGIQVKQEAPKKTRKPRSRRGQMQ
jgi:excisionase family DNA binding protein